MDSIAFIDTDDADVGVRIVINGRELIEIVRDIEMPFALREGHPRIAGNYCYFGPMFVFAPARHFLGEPANDWTDGDGRVYVLACSCGFPQCWALSSRIQLREREVVWSEFRQIHRGSDAPQGQWRYTT